MLFWVDHILFEVVLNEPFDYSNLSWIALPIICLNILYNGFITEIDLI